MESLSRLIYPASTFPFSVKTIKAVNKVNLSFIWKNKNHYIRKEDMVKFYEEGGGIVIDLDVMNDVLKLKWLKSFLINIYSFWFIIPKIIFQKVGE